MNTYNWNPHSFVDSPEGIAAVVYCCGCTLSCPYCFNPELRDHSVGRYAKNGIERLIYGLRRKNSKGDYFNTADWLIFSGGEPCCRNIPEIMDIMKYGYNADLKIGLYSSAFNEAYKQFLEPDSVITYYHIDYKYNKYDQKTLENISHTYIKSRKYGSCPVHVNTTIMRSVHTEEILLEMKDELCYIFQDKELPVFINNGTIPNKRYCWILTPVSPIHTNTLEQIDYAKDGFIEEDIDFIKAMLNLELRSSPS